MNMPQRSSSKFFIALGVLAFGFTFCFFSSWWLVPLAQSAAETDAGSKEVMASSDQSRGPKRVRPGIEVLASSGFSPLAGKRIGVITNHTGIDAARRSTLNILLSCPRSQGSGYLQPRAWSGRYSRRKGSFRGGSIVRTAHLQFVW